MTRKIRLSESDLNRLIQRILEQEDESEPQGSLPKSGKHYTYYMPTSVKVSQFTKKAKKLYKEIIDLDAELGLLLASTSEKDKKEDIKFMSILRDMKAGFDNLTDSANEINNIILTMSQKKMGGRSTFYGID
jgi:hypothetical protein